MDLEIGKRVVIKHSDEVLLLATLEWFGALPEKEFCNNVILIFFSRPANLWFKIALRKKNESSRFLSPRAKNEK